MQNCPRCEDKHDGEDLLLKLQGNTKTYSWGLLLPEGYQLRDQCIPKPCNWRFSAKEVACGEDHAAILASTGQMYVVGQGTFGQLGLGEATVQTSSPTLVAPLKGHTLQHVACGWRHTAALTAEGILYTWGDNDSGALGLGDRTPRFVPAVVKMFIQETTSAPRIASVACGSRHSAVVTEAGELYTWGDGDNGQLGTGHRRRELAPVLIQIFGSPRIRQAACGVNHTVFVTRVGQVYTTGGNAFGQLGTGDLKSTAEPVLVRGLAREHIVQIACSQTTAALSCTGDVWVWGLGASGQHLTPHLIEPLKKKNVTSIACGRSALSAITASGQLYTWGNNASGELGLGDFDARPLPTVVSNLDGQTVLSVACGGSHMIAIVEASADALPVESNSTHSRVESRIKEKAPAVDNLSFSRKFPFSPDDRNTSASGQQHRILKLDRTFDRTREIQQHQQHQEQQQQQQKHKEQREKKEERGRHVDDELEMDQRRKNQINHELEIQRQHEQSLDESIASSTRARIQHQQYQPASLSQSSAHKSIQQKSRVYPAVYDSVNSVQKPVHNPVPQQSTSSTPSGYSRTVVRDVFEDMQRPTQQQHYQQQSGPRHMEHQRQFSFDIQQRQQEEEEEEGETETYNRNKVHIQQQPQQQQPPQRAVAQPLQHGFTQQRNTDSNIHGHSNSIRGLQHEHRRDFEYESQREEAEEDKRGVVHTTGRGHRQASESDIGDAMFDDRRQEEEEEEEALERQREVTLDEILFGQPVQTVHETVQSGIVESSKRNQILSTEVRNQKVSEEDSLHTSFSFSSVSSVKKTAPALDSSHSIIVQEISEKYWEEQVELLREELQREREEKLMYISELDKSKQVNETLQEDVAKNVAERMSDLNQLTTLLDEARAAQLMTRKESAEEREKRKQTESLLQTEIQRRQNLESQLTETLTTADSLSSKLERSQEEIRRLQEILDEKTTNQQQALGLTVEQSKEMQRLEATVTEYRLKKREVEEQVRKEREKVIKLESQIKHEQDRRESLEVALKSARESIQHEQTNRNQLESVIEQYNEEKNLLAAENSNLIEKISELESKINSMDVEKRENAALAQSQYTKKERELHSKISKIEKEYENKLKNLSAKQSEELKAREKDLEQVILNKESIYMEKLIEKDKEIEMRMYEREHEIQEQLNAREIEFSNSWKERESELISSMDIMKRDADEQIDRLCNELTRLESREKELSDAYKEKERTLLWDVENRSQELENKYNERSRDLQQEVDQLQSEMARRFEEKIQEIDQDIMNRLQEKEHELDHYRIELQNKTEEMEEVSKRLSYEFNLQLNEKEREIQQMKSQFERELRDKETEMKRITSDLEEKYKDRYQEFKRIRHELEEELREKDKQLLLNRSETEQRLRQREKEREKEHEERLEEMKRSLEREKENTVSQIQYQLQELRRQHERDMLTRQSEFDTVKADLEEEYSNKLEKEIRRLSEQMRNREAELTSESREREKELMDRLSNRESEARSEMNQLEKQFREDLEQTEAKYKDRVHRLQKEVNGFEEALHEERKRREVVERDIEVVQTTKETDVLRNEQDRRKIQELTRLVNSSQETIARLEEEVHVGRQKYNIAMEERTLLRKQVHMLRSRMTRSHSPLDSTKDSSFMDVAVSPSPDVATVKSTPQIESSEIRSKLNHMAQNKTFLEEKMANFEQKLKNTNLTLMNQSTSKSPLRSSPMPIRASYTASIIKSSAAAQPEDFIGAKTVSPISATTAKSSGSSIQKSTQLSSSLSSAPLSTVTGSRLGVSSTVSNHGGGFATSMRVASDTKQHQEQQQPPYQQQQQLGVPPVLKEGRSALSWAESQLAELNAKLNQVQNRSRHL